MKYDKQIVEEIARESEKKQRFMYSNALGIFATPFDFLMTFDTFDLSGGGQVIRYDDSLMVAMSPVRMKLLCAALLSALEDYEKEFGPISLTSTKEEGNPKGESSGKLG